MCRAGNDGDDLVGSVLSWLHLIAALENSAEDALLPPGLSGLELAIGGQAGHPGARSGSAWGAVISISGTEDEVAAVVGRVVSGGKQFDVVDRGAANNGDARRRQRPPNLHRQGSEWLGPGRRRFSCREETLVM